MSFLDKFEKKVEDVVSGAFSKAFRSEIKPVEIASAVRRAMDERAAAVARDRTIAPNDFKVTLSATDEDNFEAWGADALAEEIAAAATEHAMSQSYSFVGPVRVTFDLDSELTTGQYQIASATKRGAVAPATTLNAAERHPIVDIDGRRYLLTGPVTVIGRGSEADIVVDDTGVSRKHLELRVTPRGVIATDLNSTNGLYVEGHKVPAATLVDGNTLTIGRTRILFWSQPGSEG
ncbi:FhaA domain-containing protein [Bowdeniella massiliensis]|uniref:FhaA domain-containing protein n=1 Tax=Bowdeniella massiliensis TaxID=2932264 RepID=UPI0020292AB2|nr:DUF3662 and FHA domain-containing protein [Bowdeniella massiliensis]